MPPENTVDAPARVTSYSDIDPTQVVQLLARFGMAIDIVPAGSAIPGSYWGGEEAGLVGNTLKVRQDTPVHSILHEACHFICMDRQRRMGLDTDAGGDYDEENAVCYLQILLSDFLPTMGRAAMARDMDAWGYTFRLGSAKAWFERDAEDARAWLLANRLIDETEQPTFRLRDAAP